MTMHKIMIFGTAAVLLGMFIFIGYGVYVLVISYEIPIEIRIGIISVVLGVLIVLISIILENIKEKRRTWWKIKK